MRRLYLFSLLLTGYAMLALPASAHPLDVAYLDFGRAPSSTTLTLTVAVHPYQAFELIRGTNAARFDLKKLEESGDLISAYVQDHVSVRRGDVPCTWTAEPAHTPPTELEAVGDGVTVAGLLSCASSALSITAKADLFTDGFPTQTNILRLELPDGYADRMSLDRKVLSGTVDISELFQSPAEPSSSAPLPRRPDSAVTEIAQRVLDPGLGLWGFLGLLLSAMLIGALHALGPGHGKSLMAATLVGSRATVGRVLALGTVMTMTHVSDVFLMAILAGGISAVIPPTRLLSLFETVSAIGLVVLGVGNLWRAVIRYRQVSGNTESGDMDEAHRRAHELGLSHSHESAHESGGDGHGNFKHVLWMGFIGSLAPCPTAWAVFMATLAAGRLGAGVVLLVAFSIGLYATIIAIGLLLVISKTYALRRTPQRLTYALPIISACVIIGLGSALLLRGTV